MTGEPARPPLARAMQLHRIEPHLHAKTSGMVRHRTLGWKQRKLSMSPARFVERFNLATPRFALAIINLAQVQNRTLHHTTTCTASAFDNAPVTVLLAVLPSPCESQVHGPRFYAQAKSRKEGRSSLHAFPPRRPLKRFSFCRQNSKIPAPVGKVGLARQRRREIVPRRSLHVVIVVAPASPLLRRSETRRGLGSAGGGDLGR
jgi:hypothetical protein